MQTSSTYNANKCKGTCTNCFKTSTGCLRENVEAKPVWKKRLFSRVAIVVLATLLTGCSHAQWVAVKDSTQLASFVNPLGFAIHMGAAAGALFTEPDNNNHIEE
jgi:hypothetical protein